MFKKNIYVYRAITGKRIPDKDQDVFAGVEDNVLSRTGIRTSNNTSYGLTPSERDLIQAIMPEARRVPGLPVYLSLREAQGWISGKKFIENGKPAIAVAKLPIQIVTDKIQIWRTSGFERDDYLLTKELLLKHLSGNVTISGECDLRGNLDEISKFVSFLRPEKMVDGHPEGKFILEKPSFREK